MFTYELARRMTGTGVTANVLHPGVVNSGFGAEDPSRIFKYLVPFWRPFMKTPQQGAGTSIYLASSPEVEGVTGRYFTNSRPQPSNDASYDIAAAIRLWQISAGLVGLNGGPAAHAGLGVSND
jgi:NAD(P)-dependent dehydrogenase (short-subunit alcohol dehydrogenase family)